MSNQQEITMMCWQEFEDVYGHLGTDDNGLVISVLSRTEILNPNRVWTEFDDGHLESGIHYVNRLRYVLTNKEYPEETLVIVDSPTIHWKDFDEDAKERRIQYMAKKMADKPTSDIKWEAEAGVGYGMDDFLERARKNADDDIGWDEDLEYFEVAYAAIQVLVARLKEAETKIEEPSEVTPSIIASAMFTILSVAKGEMRNLSQEAEYNDELKSQLEDLEESYAIAQTLVARLETAEAEVQELRDKAKRVDNATVIVAIDPDDMKKYVGMDDISHISQSDYRYIEDKIAAALYSHGLMSFDEIAKLVIEDNFADEVWGTYCDECGERWLKDCKCDDDRALYYFVGQGNQTAYTYEAEHTLSPEIVGETIYIEGLDGAKRMAQLLSKRHGTPVEIREDNSNNIAKIATSN
jgi:hypothetical protein